MTERLIAFESLPNNLYMDYVRKAEMIHNMGIRTDTVVLELAKIIYYKEMNENQKNQERG